MWFFIVCRRHMPYLDAASRREIFSFSFSTTTIAIARYDHLPSSSQSSMYSSLIIPDEPIYLRFSMRRTPSTTRYQLSRKLESVRRNQLDGLDAGKSQNEKMGYGRQRHGMLEIFKKRCDEAGGYLDGLSSSD